MKFLDKLHQYFGFSTLLKPLIYAVLFSLIYDAGYYFLSLWPQGFSWAVCLLSAAYGLGVYFICTLAWGRKRGSLSGPIAGFVFVWSLAASICGMLASWLMLNAYGNQIVMILLYLIAAAGLIFLVPYSLLLFRGLYIGIKPGKELFVRAWKTMISHFSSCINTWLVILIVRIVWDSWFSGPMGLGTSFSLLPVFSNMLFMGQPFLYPVLLVFLSGGNLAPGIGELILLYVMTDLLGLYIGVNAVCWLGRLMPDEKKS